VECSSRLIYALWLSKQRYFTLSSELKDCLCVFNFFNVIDACGRAGNTRNFKRSFGRVVGGKIADAGSWPWQAAITVTFSHYREVSQWLAVL